jgi:hypothetical protein
MLTSETNSQAHGGLQEVLSVLNSGITCKKIKNITKSFRIDEDTITKIDQQARNNNTSLNADINSLLRKYVEWDMLASKVGMIPLARPIVAEIFQSVMTTEQVVKLANDVAKNVIHETAYFMKGNLTLESFLSWLKVRMERCSKLNYTIENNTFNPQIKVIFKHDLGENWSIYHKIVLEYIIHEILRETDVQVEASGTALILCFR